MGIICVNTPSASYRVSIGSGILNEIGATAAELTHALKAAVVTDDNVAPLYLKTVEKSLKDAEYEVHSLVLPAGERTKSLNTLENLYAFFSDSGIARSDAVFALGGGVIGDVTGFAASTWKRGVPLFQIPTTLLAQVDSSVGGKTAVDLPQGKNLAGTFYQPLAVIADTDVLATLPDDIMSGGMAEVIKYGCICDAQLFDSLSCGIDLLDLTKTVERCVCLKRDIVERDEKDTGEREILNFGHTAGHAVESLGGYSRWSHGQSIAIGMVIATRLGQRIGVTKSGVDDRIVEMLRRYGLPIDCPYRVDDMMDYIEKDKKVKSGTLSFILLTEIGKAARTPIGIEQLRNLLIQVIG